MFVVTDIIVSETKDEEKDKKIRNPKEREDHTHSIASGHSAARRENDRRKMEESEPITAQWAPKSRKDNEDNIRLPRPHTQLTWHDLSQVREKRKKNILLVLDRAKPSSGRPAIVSAYGPRQPTGG